METFGGLSPMLHRYTNPGNLPIHGNVTELYIPFFKTVDAASFQDKRRNNITCFTNYN